MKASRSSIIVFALVAACGGDGDGKDGTNGKPGADGSDGTNGADGQDGRNSLTDVTPVSAGADCAYGGVRITSGVDDNGNGQLDEAEVDNTQFVCNGTVVTEDGGVLTPATLVNVTDEPAGTNCAEGGVRITTGSDGNGNGVLDASEEGTPRYVCNGSGGGDLGELFGAQPVVRTYTSAGVFAPTATSDTITAQTATITIPRTGTVFATASADVFCSTAASTSQCPAGGSAIRAFLTIAQDGMGTGLGNGGDPAQVQLTPDITESVTATQIFTLNAGTYTFNARALGVTVPNNMAVGNIGYFRRSLTLVFVPSAQQ